MVFALHRNNLDGFISMLRYRDGEVDVDVEVEVEFEWE